MIYTSHMPTYVNKIRQLFRNQKVYCEARPIILFPFREIWVLHPVLIDFCMNAVIQSSVSHLKD